MKSRDFFLVSILCLWMSLLFVVLGNEKLLNEDKKLHELEYDAIRKLHDNLDDDKNGDVDYTESKEFFQHELNVKDQKRHSKFHSGDGSISLNDLWNAWRKNHVLKWTPDDVAVWLTDVVHLPQYAEIFRKNKINGHYLPRLASNDNELFVQLKIPNAIERKKISLRAMDVVLFGDLRRHNYFKDFILGLLVIVAMMGFWFSNTQKRKVQKQMESMIKDVEILQDAEKNLAHLKNRLQEAEENHQVVQHEKFQLESNLKEEIEAAKREAQRLREAREGHSDEIHTRLKLAEQELIQVREALNNSEKEVEYLSSELSLSLKKWLKLTYQKEVKNFQYRRNVAMKKMEEAKDACSRLKRKRNTLLGSLRLVHDQYIDDVDQRILGARSLLAEVTNDLEELQYRWQQIETCCHLDLGVRTSFLWCDSTESLSNRTQSFRNQNATGQETTNVTSNEKIPVQRAATCPTFEENSNARVKARKGVERHASDPSGSTSETYEYEESVNTYDFVDGESERSTKRSNFRREGSTISQDSSGRIKSGKVHPSNSSVNKNCNSSSFSSLEEKISSPKRKWWTRNKKHHSDELENRDIQTKASSRSKDNNLP